MLRENHNKKINVCQLHNKLQCTVICQDVLRVNLKDTDGSRSDAATSYELLTDNVYITLKQKEGKINETENCTSE